MKITGLGFLRSLIALMPLGAAIQLQACVEASKPVQLPDERLLKWLARPRIPVFDATDSVIQTFVVAALLKQKVKFVYLGRPAPHEHRIVSPGLIFRIDQVEGW